MELKLSVRLKMERTRKTLNIGKAIIEREAAKREIRNHLIAHLPPRMVLKELTGGLTDEEIINHFEKETTWNLLIQPNVKSSCRCLKELPSKQTATTCNAKIPTAKPLKNR